MRGSFLSSPIAAVGTAAAAAAITAGLLLFSRIGDDGPGENPGREQVDEHVASLARSLAENTLRVEPRTCEQISKPDYQGFDIRVDWDAEIQSEKAQQLLSTKYSEELEWACQKRDNGH